MSSSQTPPRETILVVDEELEVLALVADILLGEGYTVLRASHRRKPSWSWSLS
jgi:CheY-like chemotaxis protein